MIMFDIDDYKLINDTFGHAAGDRILVEFSSLLKKNTRKMDICGRLGGDEFGLVLPETDSPRAGVIAERVRSSLASLEIDFNGVMIKATSSIGISQLKGKIKDLQTLMETADSALYQVKHLGKNQVKIFEGK